MQRIIEFLESGKAVYMESAVMGTGDHTSLRPYFGLSNNSIPCTTYSEIETIIAESTEIFSGYSLNYLYGSNADYGLDVLDADLGTSLSHSQDDAVRSVYYDSGLYRTIASSTFFGAMADGVDDNTKADVMTQYLSFLNGDPSPNIVASQSELNFGITFPENLYTNELEISNTGLERLSITDIVIFGDGFNYYGSTEFELYYLDQQALEVEFEMDEPDQYLGELIIYSNDPDMPELVIQLSAECVLPPVIQYDPPTLDIVLFENQTHEEIITLSNSGGSELSCEFVIIDSSQYSGWLESDQNSCVVQPDENYEVIFTFDPDGLEAGQYSAEIVISHNDPNQDELVIPITMSLEFTNVDDDLSLTGNKLIGNYPNPFNPSTTIRFESTNLHENTRIEIYNLKGQKIKNLPVILSGVEGSAIWNGTDYNDQPVSSGIYFYKLKSGNFEQTKKMILMK